MKLFRWAHDGGNTSGVKGLFLIEAKCLFSIVLLRFSKGSREAYHTHAFSALTLWLRGEVCANGTWALTIPVHTRRGC